MSSVAQMALRDTVITALDESESQASVVLDEMHKSGIVDKTTQGEVLKTLYTNYMNYASNAKSSTELIEQMYSNLNGQDISLSLISSYASTMFAIASLTPVTSIVLPVVAGVCYFTDTLSKAFSLGALGQLYYSGQARRADRVAIELGLFPKP